MNPFLIEKKGEFEEFLRNFLESKKMPKTLKEAASYSLLDSGKRLRPLLMMAIAHGLKKEPRDLFPLTAAVEMIHTYSLIHDDLPCMDDDDFRRGKPSLHKAFNEGIAVLTGDFLLTESFVTLANIRTSSDQKIKIIDSLSQSVSGNGMVGGQLLDIEGENKNLTIKDLKNIHSLKTGALFASSFQIAALFCDGDEKTVNALTCFGAAFGKAFQVMDDVLDVSKKREGGNKSSVSSDQKNNKTTFVTLLGEKGALDFAKSLLEEGKKTLKDLPFDFSLLFSLTHLSE